MLYQAWYTSLFDVLTVFGARPRRPTCPHRYEISVTSGFAEQVAAITELGNARIHSMGWETRFFLKDGVVFTYLWIDARVKTAREARK